MNLLFFLCFWINVVLLLVLIVVIIIIIIDINIIIDKLIVERRRPPFPSPLGCFPVPALLPSYLPWLFLTDPPSLSVDTQRPCFPRLTQFPRQGGVFPHPASSFLPFWDFFGKRSRRGFLRLTLFWNTFFVKEIYIERERYMYRYIHTDLDAAAAAEPLPEFCTEGEGARDPLRRPGKGRKRPSRLRTLLPPVCVSIPASVYIRHGQTSALLLGVLDFNSYNFWPQTPCFSSSAASVLFLFPLCSLGPFLFPLNSLSPLPFPSLQPQSSSFSPSAASVLSFSPSTASVLFLFPLCSLSPLPFPPLQPQSSSFIPLCSPSLLPFPPLQPRSFPFPPLQPQSSSFSPFAASVLSFSPSTASVLFFFPFPPLQPPSLSA
ncbi:uncharacterized protein LOC134293418 isoform X2 [Anolis carolinensis]|uniref:uncharacterized protein LOC134293418 isoform X2 n=1 Tax=Anolis carolinensis TaxID=28377 RepID=UPI002F2B17AC